MHFLTKLYKNDYERHFMNCSEISLKTMIKIWNFIPLLLLWLLKWIEELNKVLVSNRVCEKHRRYKAFQIKMKNGNFKCERKIRRCGNNLFKITLVYRVRMKKIRRWSQFFISTLALYYQQLPKKCLGSAHKVLKFQVKNRKLPGVDQKIIQCW